METESEKFPCIQTCCAMLQMKNIMRRASSPRLPLIITFMVEWEKYTVTAVIVKKCDKASE